MYFLKIKKLRLQRSNCCRSHYTSFPFLTNKKSVVYLQRTKVIFIMRGLPGSGKSFVVDKIKRRYRSSCFVCSADFYFAKSGTYNFNVNKLSEAHNYCKASCKKAMLIGKQHIIIDNTNVQKFEIQYYLNLAKKYNYHALVVQPQTPWRFDADELEQRNKHGCLASYIMRRKSQFIDILPLYYGFFLNEFNSYHLIQLSESHFYECMKIFKKFAFDLTSAFDGCLKDILFRMVYNIDMSKILHCTTHFGEDNTYSSDSFVKKSIGKCFELGISGFLFSPRTCCATVELYKSVQKLWNGDDFFVYKEDKPGRIIPCGIIDQNILRSNEDSEVRCLGDSLRNNCKVSDKTAVIEFGLNSNNRSSKHSFYVPIHQNPSEVFGSILKMDRGSRTHLTIGCCEGIQAVQSGFDCLHFKYMLNQNRFKEIVIVHNFTYLYYGEGQCEVKFDWPLKVKSLFGGQYSFS